MSHQPPQSRPPRPNSIAGFIDRFGWRAYALPVLTLLTLVALFRAGGGHDSADAVSHRTSRASLVRATASAPRPAPVHSVSISPDPTGPNQRTRSSRTSPRPAHTAASASAATPCHKNLTARKVVVSIAAQHVWMCARATMVYSSPVTTGKSTAGHSTPTGTFRVQGNVTDTTLTGPGYSMHVAYWIQFNGDIGFHDASWQTMKFGSPNYVTQGSRGCVHMPRATVAWLHKWVQVGHTVVVVSKA